VDFVFGFFSPAIGGYLHVDPAIGKFIHFTNVVTDGSANATEDSDLIPCTENSFLAAELQQEGSYCIPPKVDATIRGLAGSGNFQVENVAFRRCQPGSGIECASEEEVQAFYGRTFLNIRVL
jgi:hypothetical protein